MEWIFEHFNLIFLAVAIFSAPLMFKLAIARTKQQQEKVREIATRLGLTLNDPAEKIAQGQPLAAGIVMPELQENARTRGVKPEDIERLFKMPVIGKILQLSLPWNMTGKIANTAVCVHPVREGENSQIHFHALFKTPLGFEIAIMPEFFGLKLGKAILQRLRDIQIGDPEFDAKLHVRGDNASAIQSWLLENRRKDVLMEFFRAHSSASLDRTGLHYIDHKERIEYEAFQKTFDLLTSTLRQIE